MNTNNNTENSQEIDLSYIYKSSLSFLKSIELFTYRTLHFAFKNIVKLCVVLILGVVLGYFWDGENCNIYKHEIILKTNFNSSDFLYKKIASIKNNYSNQAITNIEINPIVDVLSFVEDGSKRVDIAKYLSANNIELSKHKIGNQTELIYKNHVLTIYTKGKDIGGKIVNQFLEELNSEPYFVAKQKIRREQTANTIEEFQKSLDYINAYFEKVATQSISTEKNINVEFDAQLADLIIQKNQLSIHLENMNTSRQLEEQKTFFDAYILPNIYVYIMPLYRKITILPVLFVLGYLCLLVIIERYKKYRLLEEK